MKAVKENPCDVVLLDITMPNKNGLDVLKQIRTESPRLPVLVLSMHAEDQYAIRVLRAGAAGYLTKESAPAKLVQAGWRPSAQSREGLAAMAATWKEGRAPPLTAPK